MTEKVKWTVMVYMAADTGESFYRSALEDVAEMAAAEFNPDEIKVLVYLVAPSPWAAKCWQVKGKGQITEPEDPILTTETMAAQSRSPLSFQELMSKVQQKEKYQAEHYLLVLWGHGEGIDWKEKVLGKPGVKRFAQGSQSALELAELGRMIFELEHQLGVEPDRIVLGFDSCLMSMVEVYYEIKQKAGWVVAANDEIPDTGWPYTMILNGLASGDQRPGPGQLAAQIPVECTDWYSTKINKSVVSFSACNLSEIKPLTKAVKQLSQALVASLEAHATTSLKAITESRDFAEDYGERAYVDLSAFCAKLKDSEITDDVRTAASKVYELLETKTFVIKSSFSDEYPYKYTKDSRAVSICFPESEDLVGSLDDLQINWESYESLDFSEETGWPAFVRKFWSQQEVEQDAA